MKYINPEAGMIYEQSIDAGRKENWKTGTKKNINDSLAYGGTLSFFYLKY